MDSHSPLPLSSPSNLQILTLLFLFHLITPASSDSTAFVFKKCATATQSQNPQFGYSQTLDSLFAQLTAQSSQSSFFKTMELIGNQNHDDDTAIISGLFQCRQDLTTQDQCLRCVQSLPQMFTTMCGHSTAARVQLEGCYAQYETEGSDQSGSNNVVDDQDLQVLHVVCGEAREKDHIDGDDNYYAMELEGAFGALESGIQNSVNNGFYSGRYESVEMMAQCEGDVERCECSECVSDAVQVAQRQCLASLSAQIYLQKCFITYTYHPQHSFSGNCQNFTFVLEV